MPELTFELASAAGWWKTSTVCGGQFDVPRIACSMNTAIWSRVTGVPGQYLPPPQPAVMPSRPNCSIQGSKPVVHVISENGTPGTHVGGV